MDEQRGKGAQIAGDVIQVECRSPGQWTVFQMSGQHKGSKCIAKKNAKAVIVKPYTNVKDN